MAGYGRGGVYRCNCFSENFTGGLIGWFWRPVLAAQHVPILSS
jgi:hypothetical protein